MALMLQVVGVHAASMGQNVRRLLGDSELKIGRDSDNDWILPQSYVSRHQAVIRCVNGLYFLEQVEMTVFGPSVLTRQERFFIQTVFHRPQAENEAYRVASLAQHNPQIAQRLSLVDGLQHGTSIRVRLRADSRVTIDEPEQTLHWRNATVGVQFMVQIPRIDWRTDYLFVIEVEADGAPIGRCKFRLTTTKQGSPNSEPRACGKLNRYERVFLSYASEDESVVSNFAQVLEAQGLDYFLDVLSLRSGDDWQSKLKEHIERSDLFLLCWSRHAAQSAWVRKEIEWALSAQRREPTRRPDIRPLLLDGPPVPPPPGRFDTCILIAPHGTFEELALARRMASIRQTGPISSAAQPARNPDRSARSLTGRCSLRSRSPVVSLLRRGRGPNDAPVVSTGIRLFNHADRRLLDAVDVRAARHVRQAGAWAVSRRSWIFRGTVLPDRDTP
jgi:hypothetical protein